MKKLILLGLLVPGMALANDYDDGSHDTYNEHFELKDKDGHVQERYEGTGQGWDIYDRWGHKVGSLDPQ